MKTSLKLLFAGMVTAFGCSIAPAQIIYSNSFDGGAVTLHGSAPTVANSLAGGSGSATWNVLTNGPTAFINQNGTIGGSQNTALLPFSPQAGYLYTLTATVSFSAAPGNWIALGFAGHNPAQNAGSGKMTDASATGPDGFDWLIANDAAGNNEQFFAGGGASPATGIFGSTNLMSGVGTFTLQVDLNTTGSKWSIYSFINGQQLGTNFTYASNPSIVAVGLGQNTLGAPGGVTWNEIDLTGLQVPEPSTLALAGLGFASLLLRRRQKKS